MAKGRERQGNEHDREEEDGQDPYPELFVCVVNEDILFGRDAAEDHLFGPLHNKDASSANTRMKTSSSANARTKSPSSF